MTPDFLGVHMEVTRATDSLGLFHRAVLQF